MKRWSLFAILLLLLTGGISAAPMLPLPGQRAVWQPAPGTTWQIQFVDPLNTAWDVQMYDVDLFDTPIETIEALRDAGRIVICYISAGSYEDWRPDAEDFPENVLGNDLDGWEGERWLDIRNLDVLGPIMEARMDLAVDKGCDGIDPDNINGYTNDTGFALTYAHQLTYNRFLATEARQRNLSIGLKNDLEQIPDLVDDYDWALNEQCFYFDECELLLPFIEAGKAVFSIEYEGDPAEYCPKAVALGFSTLTKPLYLNDSPPNQCTADETLPDTPQLIAPGNGMTINVHLPTFQWTGGNTTTFKLKVKTLDGVKVIKETLDAATVCVEADCHYDAPTSLANDVYQWKVVAKNALGKAKSAKFSFTVDFPGKPVLTSPVKGDVISITPTITWEQVAAATEYRVNFKRLSDGAKLKGAWTAAADLCAADSCSYTPATALLPGTYKLWVKARAAGVPNKSSSGKIKVQVE